MPVPAEGDMANARFRYETVFGVLPSLDMAAEILPVPTEKLPATLVDGVDMALAKSPQLEVGGLVSEIARAETQRLKSVGYFPKPNLIAQAKWKDDVAGAVGGQQEQLIRVEMTFPFNLAGTAIDTINASKQVYLASSQRLLEARKLIREQVQGAWQQFHTARAASQ